MRNFTNKIIVLFILMFVLIINVNANTKETVKFSKCVDGDTAVFLIGSEKVRIRFLAIDTPETVHPTKSVEAYGKNASEYTCTKITNAKKIELEYDDGSTKLDKYGRTLAWVWVDNSLLQKELIDVGYAKVKYIYGTYAYTNELYQEQEKAKKEKIGLWSSYVPISYSVTFYDGTDTKKVNVNEDETIKNYTPKKTGYKFLGWYLNDKKFDFNTRITSNLDLKAKYKQTISFIDIIILIFLIIIGILTNKNITKKKLKKLF